MSGIARKRGSAARILAVFVFSHRPVQVCSWGTSEKWAAIAGASHWWGAGHHFQWLHCASLHMKAIFKKKKKSLRASFSPHIFLPCPGRGFKLPESLTNQCHSFKSSVAPTNRVVWHLTAIYPCIYFPIKLVTDEEIKSVSLRLGRVDCPFQSCRRLLPRSELWGSWGSLHRVFVLEAAPCRSSAAASGVSPESHTPEMPLSSSLRMGIGNCISLQTSP